ncbi:NAD-dependent epimerase/dehydratase [Reticulomyxa filosa]|uniref:NAD-dependent epimerase/dehydratase n=1 Tax=Reticulomyxa filosa TaxID=46433 RepID=X6MBK7_RETFI|nr:NAD-dependent epimerase/dehydratase [Reticulomyxa filosa]|eukprot:ETO11368.1 NAD-dependent epimerase/dehydratase [Reticulomyxa filosa]
MKRGHSNSKSQPLVFVSGVSGFIGGHIVKTLLEHGYNVRGSVRSAKPKAYQYLFDVLSQINTERSQESQPELTFELVECDLTSDKNWAEAIEGCQYVVHTANPMPDSKGPDNKSPQTDDDFIKPATEGMLRVMKACKSHGKSLKRVVYLSSIGAMNWELWDQIAIKRPKVVISSGNDWTPVDGRCHVPPYIKSKTLAEETAWAFVKENKPSFELVCVHPTLVIGPILNGRLSDSMTMIKALLSGDYPFIPKVLFSIVDVRDVALAITLALTSPKANAKRYLLSGESVYFDDIAKLLESKYGNTYPVPTLHCPTFLVDLISKVDPLVRDFVAPICDVARFVETTPSKRDLGMIYLPVHQTLLEAAQSVIDNKLVTPPNALKYYSVKYFLKHNVHADEHAQINCYTSYHSFFVFLDDLQFNA